MAASLPPRPSGAAAPERSHWTYWARRNETTTPGRQCAGTRAYCGAVGGAVGCAGKEAGRAWCVSVRGGAIITLAHDGAAGCAGKRRRARAGVRVGGDSRTRGVQWPPVGSGFSWRPRSGHSTLLGGRGGVNVGLVTGSRVHSSQASGLPALQLQTPCCPASVRANFAFYFLRKS